MLRLIVCLIAAFSFTGSASADGYIAISEGMVKSAAAHQQIGPGAAAFQWRSVGMGPTEAAANANAIKRCEHNGSTDCKVIAVQQGGCFAVAFRNNAAAKAFQVTVGLAPTQPAVVHDALRKCSENGKNSGCTIIEHRCVHDD